MQPANIGFATQAVLCAFRRSLRPSEKWGFGGRVCCVKRPSENAVLRFSDGLCRWLWGSAHDAACGGGEEVAEDSQFGAGFGAGEDVGFGFFVGDVAQVDGFVGFFDVGDLFGGEAVAAHAFAVDAGRFGAVAGGHEVGGNVFVHAGGEGGHGVVADVAELEDEGVAAEDDVVADGNVSGEAGVVGEDGVAADDAVVGEVAVGHDPVVVADAGFADAGYGAEVEGGEFADGVAVADDEAGGFAGVFFVLRDFAEAGKLEDAVVFADGGVAVDDGVGADFGVRADFYVGADDGVRADFDTAVQFGLGVDDGGGVDVGHGFPFVPVCFAGGLSDGFQTASEAV